MNDSNATEILDTLMRNLKEIVNTKTVVGDPVTVGTMTILPVMKVSLGFGAGAGSPPGSATAMRGGGGGGVMITPIGFLVVEDGRAMMLTPSSSRWDWIAESIPDIWERLRKGSKKESSPPENPAATTQS